MLFQAIRRNANRVLEQLLRRNVDVAPQTAEKETILHALAMYADLETVRIFPNAPLHRIDAAARDLTGALAFDYVFVRPPVGGLQEALYGLWDSVVHATEVNSGHGSDVNPLAREGVAEAKVLLNRAPYLDAWLQCSSL